MAMLYVLRVLEQLNDLKMHWNSCEAASNRQAQLALLDSSNSVTPVAVLEFPEAQARLSSSHISPTHRFIHFEVIKTSVYIWSQQNKSVIKPRPCCCRPGIPAPERLHSSFLIAYI